MELVLEEAAVTIKVVSVGGKRMSKAFYSQLPRRSPFDHDSTVRGRLWGVVVDSKCCHSMRAKGWAHWHVLYECDGELAVWSLRQEAKNAPYNLIAGGPYEPGASVDREFMDACALETHRGSTDFFQGQLFDLIRDDQVAATIEDTKVYLSCSTAVLKLRTTRKEHHAAAERSASRRWPAHPNVPNYAAEAAAAAEKEMGAAEEALEQLCDQRERSAQDLYAGVVADVRRIKQARENYSAALETVGQLPQLFLGA
ncbi:hypothetical protein [Streptomyces sp. NPDC058614]|uniref:hypothetical protein n=1 Tax=Streptomyces sp. NPDC058614 TaxID=3346557 RepID=UPI00364ED9C5